MRQILTTMTALLVASTVYAQPQSQPLVQPQDVTFVGVWTVPGYADLDYTTHGLLAVEGNRGLYACRDQRPGKVAVIEIPSVGGVAKVITPCAAIQSIELVSGDPNKKMVAGGLFWQGRVKVSAYAYYDGGGSASASHFDMAPDLTGQVGPVRVGAENPGMIGGYMGIIPQEWRALLGGPAFTGQSALAIINRSCLGFCFSVFDPADVGTVNPVPSKMLIGYPYAHPDVGTWEGVSSSFTGADRWGGGAFPAGTRSILSISSHGQPVPPVGCYGYGTLNLALVGTFAPDGVRYCYDSDTNKGPKAYPRVAWMQAYDAVDLLAVKAGTKQPWDMRPYATWNFGIGSPLAAKPGLAIVGATFDPATNRIYVSTGSNEIFVFSVKAGSAPPPPPPPPPPVVDECKDDPVVVTLVAWPGATEGRRSGSLSWTVAKAVATLKSIVWTYAPQTVTVTDSRNCSTKVAK